MIDKQLIAIYMIDNVLLPKELFKAQAKTLALALTPKEVADFLKASKKKMKKMGFLMGFYLFVYFYDLG